jgi:putative spermidine/putrescine transport system permease protein
VAVGAVLGVFLVLPLLVIVPASVTGGSLIGFPPRGLSGRWYTSALHDGQWRSAFALSVRLSLLAAVLATAMGTLAALGLRRVRRGGRALRTLFIAPLVLPGVAYGLGLYSLLQRARLYGSTWPVAVGQAVIGFPFVLIVVSSSLSQVDPDIVRAASSLGARWPTVAWRVELPLIRRGLLAAFVFALTAAFDEVVVALFVAPPGVRTLPLALFTRTQDDLKPDIASVSVMTAVLVLVVLAVTSLVMRRDSAPRAAA